MAAVVIVSLCRSQSCSMLPGFLSSGSHFLCQLNGRSGGGGKPNCAARSPVFNAGKARGIIFVLGARI